MLLVVFYPPTPSSLPMAKIERQYNHIWNCSLEPGSERKALSRKVSSSSPASTGYIRAVSLGVSLFNANASQPGRLV